MTDDSPKPVQALLTKREYPFIDRYLPLDELAMIEAPLELERLFVTEAERNGLELLSGVPFELRCRTEQYGDAVFLIYRERAGDRIHMLVPKEFLKGRA